MKLRPKYENVRSNLISRVPSPSLDDCLNELLREKQHQQTQPTLTQQAFGGPLEIGYVAKRHSPPSNGHVDIAYVAKGKTLG